VFAARAFSQRPALLRVLYYAADKLLIISKWLLSDACGLDCGALCCPVAVLVLLLVLLL